MGTIKLKTKKNILFDITPTRVIVLSFALLILIGTYLLTLPIASNPGGIKINFIDALFTATSASCVTGLIIADTKTQWSLFGQIVILSMIQIGGLGIVTFTTFFSILLGKKLGIKGMLLAKESINYFSFQGILKLIKKVILFTLLIEALGAILLTIGFLPIYGTHGIFMGVFHSISSFCNAGFDIIGQYKSLTEFNNNPLILYTVAGLIIAGGIGFIVWTDLYEFKKSRKLALHTKIVLIITAILLVAGSILVYVFEHNNMRTMGTLNFTAKINASIFHAVSCRTAGYNSLPLNEMHEITKVLSILLMFIGAAPSSTGGGVKVTTVGVLFIAVLSVIRGREKTILFGNRISPLIVFKSLAIMALSGTIVILVTTLILANEKDLPFLNVLYEATSAFGTVGLTALGTPNLSDSSKLLLALTMFIGRVGPLSFAVALALRDSNKTEKIYPEGKIVVG